MAPGKVNPWEQAQAHLRSVLDEHSYKNWFSQTRFDSYTDGCLTIQVPSQFFARWLCDHYLETINDAVKRVDPALQEIRFTTEFETAEPRAEGAQGGPVPSPVSKPAQAPAFPKRTQQRHQGFNPRYTFDRFVIGSGNRFAHAAAKAVAESPARAYNPLFLYGATGLGKTHLMQAIGQKVLENDPSMNVVVISSEQFTNQLIEAIAKKSTQRFRSKYRKVDILLIDDIHFIAGKEATQEEFFHTFNELFDMHKQIVLSSDRGPKEIQGMEERLVSRFEWGLVTDIQPPDVETRVAILQNKAREEGITISQEVMRYIATAVTSNIRELEGALITAVAYGKLTERDITVNMVEEVLRDLIGSEKLNPITTEGVQRAVAERFDLRIADLKGRSRTRQVAYPRQLAMYLCKEMVSGLSLSEIGEAFGGKDHTTVLYAHQKIEARKQECEATRKLLAQLEKTIRA